MFSEQRAGQLNFSLMYSIKNCVCLSLIAIFSFLININSKICSAYRWLKVDKPEPVDFLFVTTCVVDGLLKCALIRDKQG